MLPAQSAADALDRPRRRAGRTLTATSRPSRVSRARYTSPIPPAPTRSRISYGPNRTSADRDMAELRGFRQNDAPPPGRFNEPFGSAGARRRPGERAAHARCFRKISRTASKRVGFGRGLVRSISLHPREAQGEAARVARRFLHVAEGDLDHELRPHVGRSSRRARLQRAAAAPSASASISSVRPLKVLPSMTKLAALGVARAEVQVGEPAPPPAAPPLRGENDEVEGVRGA